MKAQLANGEQILKSYTYGLTKASKLFKSSTVDHSLIVTNKRIIAESESKHGINRKEVPLNAVDYIDSYASGASNPLLLIKSIIIGIIALLACIFLNNNLGEIVENNMLIILGCVIFAVFLAIGIIRYILSKRFAVKVVFSGRMGENNLLDVGASNLAGSKSNAVIRIKVDREVGSKMVDEIGAIILNNH